MKKVTVTYLAYVPIEVEVTDEEFALLEHAADTGAPLHLTEEQRELTDKIKDEADYRVNSSAEIRLEQPSDIEPLTVSISDGHGRYNIWES